MGPNMFSCFFLLQANATWGKYKEALDVTANLQGSMDGLKAEIDAMGKQLAEEQGNISVYTDRQTKVIFPPRHLLQSC